MDKNYLIANICPPINQTQLELLINEYNSVQKRFILRDWEPATLDGGQFAEIASQLIYHQDSGTLNNGKGVNACLTYIEDSNSRNSHLYPNRKSALHTCKVLRTIYKFRSDRGAVHINPDYSANHLDAGLVIANVKWVMAEIIRIFLTSDLTKVEEIIRNLLEFSLPVVDNYGDNLLVQRTDCSTDEEILILLHYYGQEGLNRTDLGKYVHKTASAITKSISKLVSNAERKIIKLSSGNYRLTSIGEKFVREVLPEKLNVE